MTAAVKPITIFEAHRKALVEALRYTKGNPDGAAYFLDIGRTTVYRWMRDMQIRQEEYEEHV